MDEACDAGALREMLRRIVASVEQLAGVSVAINDTSGFLHQNGEDILTRADWKLLHHDCAFCQFIRDMPGGRVQCICNDLEENAELAKRADAPRWRRCHAGLNEMLVPLMYENKLVALFALGQARIRGDDRLPDPDSMPFLEADRSVFWQHYQALPEADAEKVEQAALLLHLSLKAFLQRVPAEKLQAYFLQSEYSLPRQAMDIVRNGIEHGPDVRRIAGMLYVSPSTLSRAFRREYGVSLRSYVDNRRLNLARRLLAEGRQSIRAVGLNMGFPDESSFTHWFTRKAGVSPALFRGNSAQPGPPDAGARVHASRPADCVAFARRYLQEHFRETVRVRQIAGQLQMTPDHLERLYRRQTGERLSQTLWTLRLHAAREELAQQEVSVSHVARHAGFSSDSAFSQRFHAAFGMTPSAYRESLRARAEDGASRARTDP